MAKWGDGRESGPGPKGNASGCRGFRNKGPVRARYLHIIIWNGYKIAGKAPSPLGIPQRRMPGRSGRGERAREQSCGGEAGVLYFVFSPQSCGVFPVFFGDRFSVPHGDSVRHPFGIRGRAEPAGACAPPTGGEGTILSHNLLNYVNFIPRKVAAKSFPPMPGICAIRCNRVPRIRNQKNYNTVEL